MVLRAAVGDFEDSQIYGTLQMSHDNSLRDKKYFFLPDIRSFALIAMEIVGKMCEKRFQNRYVNYNAEHVPMKLNLETVISDEDEEFGAQYGYEVEETHRMFDAVHPVEVVETDSENETYANETFEAKKRVNGSLENLMDRNRPLSPEYAQKKPTHSVTYINDTDEDEEVASFNRHVARVNASRSMTPTTTIQEKRVKKSNSLKGRKDVSKSAESASSNEMSQSTDRCLSAVDRGSVNRCVSPDPMQDEKLLELRNETKYGNKRKERKFSFSRKRSEENVLQKNKPEAFVKPSKDVDKRKDGTWLSKPQSILKSITSNDTTVSVFKAKHVDEESHLDIIEEEDIVGGQSVLNKPRQIQVKEKPKAEVWDIIDEQYYKQVNRKAANMLKKTVSSESKSSLWSFISTPDDVDDDELDDILDCLPGMTDPSDLRKSEMKLSDILEEREKATRREETRKRFSYADFCKDKSRFELIDYYELLKERKITFQDIPEDKREMLLNVVELKREEKLRKDGKTSNVLKNDEMYDSNMFPGSNMNAKPNPATDNGKAKLVSYRQSQAHSSPKKGPQVGQNDPRLERARSAPLKRPRTPMHKPMVQRPEVNPAFNDTKTVTVVKRNKARQALRRALNSKKQQNYGVHDLNRGREPQKASNMSLKYATIRKINGGSESSEANDQDDDGVLKVPIPTSESFSVTNSKPPPINKTVQRYTSFSSNESSSSISSSIHQRRTDVSFTSGEVSSLSSQAESEHYETDGHMTDIECVPVGNRLHTKPIIRGPSSKVDSGFDSGSMSSEMSDAFMNRANHFNPKLHLNGKIKPKGGRNSWARNYKMVDSISNSPYNFSNKFLPPSENPFQNKVNNHGHNSNQPNEESDSNSVDSGFSAKHKNVMAGVTSLSMSPYGQDRPMSPPGNTSKQSSKTPTSRYRIPPNTRPMSPNTMQTSMSRHDTRPMSPGSRPMSPQNRPMSPDSRPMSPQSRPMSPNVRPTDINTHRHSRRPMSPEVRVHTPNRETRTLNKSDTFSPGRKLTKPLSPKSHSRAKSLPRATENPEHVSESAVRQRGRSLSPSSSVKSEPASIASKRYRELVKQGVPLRTSVVDSSPSRQATRNEQRREEHIDSRPATAESVADKPMDDQELFENLEANGFFSSKQRSRSPYNKASSPNRTISQRGGKTDKSQRHEKRRHKRKQIPLEEIVREKPAGKSPAHRSPSKNHLVVSEDAFLNQPTSEDSETCSIKTNKSNISSPSVSKPKVMVDAELVIDRIFSQTQPTDYELDVEVEAALGLDKDPFKAVNDLYLKGRSPNPSNLDTIPMLNGMGQMHIHGCMELASGLHVITVRDLLPATMESFNILRDKLNQVGQLGTVGNQVRLLISIFF